VDRQKARLVENLRRFATDLPFNNVHRASWSSPSQPEAGGDRSRGH
jgi:hypothetical protein